MSSSGIGRITVFKIDSRSSCKEGVPNPSVITCDEFNLSGFIVGVPLANINPNAYFSYATIMLGPFDIIGGLIKALVFGFFIGLLSCYQGLQTKAGAKGVGDSTTKAVVISIISIFILNFFLSYILFQG